MRKSKKQILALAMAAMLVAGTVPTSVWGYGETSESSTLLSDTQNVSDYQEWKEITWKNNESADSSKIVLTPGATEADLGFAWYSEESGKTPAVKVGKVADLSDATVFEGESTAINRSNYANTYKASNKVTIEGYFEENTTYYYSYTDDINKPDWSDPEEYTTYDSDEFQVLLVGDPQIGASGSNGQGTSDDINIAVDTYNWNKTLTQAVETAPNASFILSAGDQIDYSSVDSNDTSGVRESEYAGFLYPSVLRSLPIATTIGNHESKGTDYQYHYNNPNSDSNLGSTNSGSDYYFSYGDVLIISLNSNNRNSLEHEELMEEAVASNPDAKWRVVMFHHDIYGSGLPHSDTDGANLRTIFAPLMDEFDIDICLTGHDHSYARSYLLSDGTAIDYGNSVAVNPEGTLYIAAGSASGSKFYQLASTKQYYVAERSNTQVPTFSTIDFTDDSLTIKTYDYNGNKYADDYTLYKTEEDVDIADLVEEAESLTESDYTAESWSNLTEALSGAKALMQFTEEDKGAATLSAVYDSSDDEDNADDMLTYYAYAQGDYAVSSDETRLKEGFSTLLDKTTITDLLIDHNAFETQYSNLSLAINNLELAQSSTTGTSNATAGTTDNTENAAADTTETAKLSLKVGKKTVKSGATVKLKKGKTVQIKLTVNGVTGKNVKYKSSNKKVVKVTTKGKLKVLKKSKKKVKITVKFGKQKITFKVKVK